MEVPSELADRIDRYLEAYRGSFRRKEQPFWAAVYLRGLLETPGRKNVENLARSVVLPADFPVADVGQALGHFLNQSPWDEGAVLRLHQQRLSALVGAEAGTFVLDELALVKQGKHSVGVQRQLSRSLGQKTNCQIAVLLTHVSSFGAFPVALRLYLPRDWVTNAERLALAGVPADARRAATRLQLGLELLDDARTAGLEAVTLAAGPNWQASDEMAQEAARRGLVFRHALPDEPLLRFQTSRERLERLGLEHYEGRSWRGFHHHTCLVLLAASFPSESASGV